MTEFHPDESTARLLDAGDPLREYRSRFCIPRRPDGRPAIYFCGNSLGLQPTAVPEGVTRALNDWAALGVDAHFHGSSPWYPYHEQFRDSGARLVGARPGEVVMMNSLTVNLHLMMVSFYRPTQARHKILIEYPVFPSDRYAVQSQLEVHGYPPQALVEVRPRGGSALMDTADLAEVLQREGDRIALVLLAGVNFFTGQLLDLAEITRLAHHHGCTIGWDLAHAAGNIPLRLHDWDVDFAVWCSYKYLNSGPGAVAGCFVHERHGSNLQLPRFAGWWGNDPETRFRMHLQPDFVPRRGADGWQLSNPPILAMAPLRASLDLFDAAGMDALRAKSERLTGYLQFLLDAHPVAGVEVITPRDPRQRGCQLSLLVHDRPQQRHRALLQAGVVCDFREPNVVRVAPVPLYNTFHEVWRFAQALCG